MSPASPRIEIWTGRIGGHIRIAQAVAQSLSQHCPSAQVEVRDIYSPAFLAGPLASTANSYDRLVSLSTRAWRTLFYLTDRPVSVRFTRWLVARQTRPAALDAVFDHDGGQAPDAIVRVIADLGHEQALEHWLAAHQHSPRPRLITLIADLVNMHHGWAAPATDCYLVPTAEAVEGLRRLGVPDEKMVRVGFPIRSSLFCRGEPRPPRGPRLRVLVMGGTSGSGRIVADVERLLRAGLPLELTVVCGKNARLGRRLARWQRPGLRLLGYTDEVPALMRWADLLISKAGPGTCCEAVACGLPILINGHLPGQEEGNTELFVRAGVACAVASPEETLALVKGFVADRERLLSMTNRALAAETCGAVDRIAEHILALARGEPLAHGA